MSYSRDQLKSLIIEQRKVLKETGCGTASEHMPNGDTESPAMQHPSDLSKGDVSGHTGDHEGKMALSQLSQIMQNADALQSIVGLDDNLQAWVQSKLTKAADYLNTVKNYMEFENSPDMPVAISLGEQKINISREELKRVTTEALLYEVMLDEGLNENDTNLPPVQPPAPEPKYEYHDSAGKVYEIPPMFGLDYADPESGDESKGWKVAPRHRAWNRRHGNPTLYRREATPAPASDISDAEMMRTYGPDISAALSEGNAQ